MHFSQRQTRMIAAALYVSSVINCVPAMAQTVVLPSGNAPGASIGFGEVNGQFTAVTGSTPLPISGKQESFALATANSASAAATVYGGAYIFNQSCTTYNSGSLTFRYRGPDGVTLMTLVSKSATDSGGGTLVSLGSSTVVDVTLPSGSTGCNATLSRVP